MNVELAVRRATENDAERLAEIYNWYIEHTSITFETEAVSVGELRQRIVKTLAGHDWLVGEFQKRIVGYAYFGPFRSRAAYIRTVESTVYVSQESKGKGFGKKLYSVLIDSASERGFREVIGVIALPNPVSIAMHARLGFREAGILRSVGYKFGAYHDVALWQRSLPPTLSAP